MPNLGERIYKLRSENNMSQGELAEKLDVSRQAVSKWENNVSIPELDKIAAMSELFGVSTDVIIKGNIAQENIKKETLPSPPIIIEHTESGFSRRKIAQILGIVLVVLGILLATLMFLLAADWVFIALFIMLAVNGVVLLVCKKRFLFALVAVNVAVVLIYFSLFKIYTAAPQQTATEELTEIISVEPDASVIEF